MDKPIKFDALKRDAKKARRADPTLTHAQHLDRLSQERHGARDFHDLRKRVAAASTRREQQLLPSEIRKAVDQLIALDTARAKSYANSPSSISFGAVSEKERKIADDMVEDILNGPEDRVDAEVRALPDETLVHVIALALFGRGHGEDSFEKELEGARELLGSDDRSRVVGYISAKPLARYLTAGLKRIGATT